MQTLAVTRKGSVDEFSNVMLAGCSVFAQVKAATWSWCPPVPTLTKKAPSAISCSAPPPLGLPRRRTNERRLAVTRLRRYTTKASCPGVYPSFHYRFENHRPRHQYRCAPAAVMAAPDMSVDAAFTKGLPKVEVRLQPPWSKSQRQGRSDFRSLHC
jgi:hypothetical protein